MSKNRLDDLVARHSRLWLASMVRSWKSLYCWPDWQVAALGTVAYASGRLSNLLIQELT